VYTAEEVVVADVAVEAVVLFEAEAVLLTAVVVAEAEDAVVADVVVVVTRYSAGSVMGA